MARCNRDRQAAQREAVGGGDPLRSRLARRRIRPARRPRRRSPATILTAWARRPHGRGDRRGHEGRDTERPHRRPSRHRTQYPPLKLSRRPLAPGPASREDERMIELPSEAEIHCAADRIFDLIIDFDGQRRWLAQSSAFRGTVDISSDPVALGTTYREPGPLGAPSRHGHRVSPAHPGDVSPADDAAAARRDHRRDLALHPDAAWRLHPASAASSPSTCPRR